MSNHGLYRGCSKGVPQGTPYPVESTRSKSAVLAPHKVWVKKQSWILNRKSAQPIIEFGDLLAKREAWVGIAPKNK